MYGPNTPQSIEISAQYRRAEVEQRLHALLGRGGEFEGRVIVVGTSLLENLDLDVDLLVTDLCPIDLLIQRLGRLHRRGPRGTAKVGIADLADARDEGGAEITVPDLRGHPYSKYLRQLTAVALEGRSVLSLPDDVGALVRSVYESTITTGALANHARNEAKQHYQGEVVCVSRSDDDDSLHDLTDRPGDQNRTRTWYRKPENP